MSRTPAYLDVGNPEAVAPAWNQDYSDGFGSEAVAKVLGEKALRQFLEDLAKEE